MGNTPAMDGFDAFRNWLPEVLNNANGHYRHRLLEENACLRIEIIDRLRAYFQKAHEDARRHLRSLVNTSLDPLEEPSRFDPADGYPKRLHTRTLKGYLGEVFAGLISEVFSPHGVEWKVPAFLFRFHNKAFDQLEYWRQTGQTPGIIPGRTGDDCLAFQKGDNGQIVRSLFCEAKCTPDHDAGMIARAHAQISSDNLISVDILRVIEILKDYDDAESSRWVEALRALYLSPDKTEYERCDLVSYVHGRPPKRPSQRAWMPTTKPHANYTANRRLEAVEIRISNVEGLVQNVYRIGEGEDRDDVSV
jgi:hypothetical protein